MSKRSRACEITKEVRQRVAIRDNGRCIICRKAVPVGCSNAHYIKRSQRRAGNRAKHSYIMSRMSLRRRLWKEHKGIYKVNMKIGKKKTYIIKSGNDN